MDRPRRIGIVAASLDILGGQGVQACSLMDALLDEGYAVTFVPINPRFPALLQRLRRVRYLRTVLNQAWYLPGLVRLAAVDVVHVFSASYASFLLAPVPAMLAARALGKRVVLHYHSGEADDHLARWGALVHPWLRLAHRLVVPSAYLRDIFARHGHDAVVIPNIVDMSRFHYRERRPLRPRLLCTRNFEPLYRVDVVIDAFIRLRRLEPGATLTLAGYGSLEEPLRRQAAAGGARDAVRFAGRVDPADMPRLYDEADLCVNASVIDNQPISILEAFASGLPVVSSPTGDIPSMVRHLETGILVPACDPDAMAAGVRWLLRHPARAIEVARSARLEIDRYTWPTVRDAWAAAYGNAVPGAEGAVRSWLTSHRTR
jgi:glycosyltransferase involved in cell wall biosynthesis